MTSWVLRECVFYYCIYWTTGSDKAFKLNGNSNWTFQITFHFHNDTVAL